MGFWFNGSRFYASLERGKVRKIVALFVVFALGFAAGKIKVLPVVHAQNAGTTLQCDVVGPCSQYIVQVNSGRGMGRFRIYPVTDQAIPTPGAAPFSGNPAVSVQFTEPSPRGDYTFTLSASEP